MHAPIIRNIAPAPVAAPEPPSILIGLAEPMRHDSTDDPSKRWAA